MTMFHGDHWDDDDKDDERWVLLLLTFWHIGQLASLSACWLSLWKKCNKARNENLKYGSWKCDICSQKGVIVKEMQQSQKWRFEMCILEMWYLLLKGCDCERNATKPEMEIWKSWKCDICSNKGVIVEEMQQSQKWKFEKSWKCDICS